MPFEDEYARLSALGFGYGPLFRGLQKVWRQGQALFAEVELPAADGADRSRYRIHPALLHAALLPSAWGSSSTTPVPRAGCRCAAPESA